MSLYLCVFEGDEELDGVDVGAYEDFGRLRDLVLRDLEHGRRGSRFPVLMLHSDCDGEWSVADCRRLRAELVAIASELRGLPASGHMSDWQRALAHERGLEPENCYDEFIDVDGEPLLARMADLCDTAEEAGQPILFQ